MTQRASRCDGALFINDRKTGSQPDLRGRIELTPAVLKELVDIHKAGGKVTLAVAAWNKVSSRGTDYLSLSAEARDDSEYEKTKGGGGRQETQRQAPRTIPRGEAPRRGQEQEPPQGDLDDEIPF